MVPRMVCLISAVVALLTAATASAASPVSAPKVQRALVAAGYPAKSRCGQAMIPPPSLVGGQVTQLSRVVATCWIVVEQDGYSVQVIPYISSRLAKLAYNRTYNPAATTTRKTAIGNVVLTAFRLPRPEWQRISRLVSSAVERQR